MSIQNASVTTADVSAIEAWVDNEFHSKPVPHQVRDVSLWHLLTYCEDKVRLDFKGMSSHATADIERFVDQLKYSMKYCVQRVLSESQITSKFPLPQKVTPQVYTRSRDLVYAGLSYAAMVRIFSSLHAGESTIEVNDRGEHCIVYHPKYDIRYSVLEIFDHGQEVGFDITTLAFGLLRGTLIEPELENFFKSSTRMRLGRVIYRYEPGCVSYLTQIIPQRPLVIPDDFMFDWGSGLETQALINSLQLRCLYHILCVDFAAREFRIPGGFDSSLVLKLTREELIDDLSLCADLGHERIARFVDFLTLGQGSHSPDIALQPLVRAANGEYMLSCFFIISNDMQRNLMSLMARTQSSVFNRQSCLFERGMIAKLVDAAGLWPASVQNRNFKAGGRGEEIDMLLVDKASKSILILECAWMLQPGDPQEIFNRLGTCAKKVNQVERKRAFFREHLRDILPSLGLDRNEGDQWSVEGMVVIEGFGGQQSRVAEIGRASCRERVL